MEFTRDSLWQLRKEIVLNSVFIADYRNSFHIDPVAAGVFFDGFLDEVKTRMGEGIPGFDDAHFYDHLQKYDNPYTLWEYYSSLEFNFSEWIEGMDEAA